jgi:Cof subfamily protein (haloacid dehalogenase superfamily)
MPKPQPLPEWRSEPAALEPFASVELVAVDLDGTLVEANGEVVDQVQSIQHGLRMRRWGRPGVRLTYATGRSLTWVLDLEKRLSTKIPSGTPLVLYNGSVVMESVTGTLIERREIPITSLEAIVDLATAHDADVYAYLGPSEWDTDGNGREIVVGWSAKLELPVRDVNGAMITWNPRDWPSICPVAILVSTPLSTVEDAGLAASLENVPGISVTAGGRRYLEIRPEGSNKATGLRAASQRLGVDSRHVLALGDSDNDVEMLDWAGIAVVVDGATAAALAHSDYVTRFGASRGAIEVLRAIKYARRYF